jgi:hypothetical protein
MLNADEGSFFFIQQQTAGYIHLSFPNLPIFFWKYLAVDVDVVCSTKNQFIIIFINPHYDDVLYTANKHTT